jgi:hypothetical protein
VRQKLEKEEYDQLGAEVLHPEVLEYIQKNGEAIYMDLGKK